MDFGGATLRRAGRIANVLFRQGFEFFVEQTPLKQLVTPECRREVEEACTCNEGPANCPCGHARPLSQRLLTTAVELGPTFIKIAQIASTRPDLVPPEYSEPLRTLQERVPPFPFEQARQVVEEELGRPLGEAFAAFEEAPIASASLSQVHYAELPDGTPVAVKVQRPGIRAIIEEDLRILRWLARQVSRLVRGVRNLRPEAAVEEFGRWTLRELDFRLEGENYREFRRNFAQRDDIVFPKVYDEYTTPRCLTMERVEGMRIHEIAPRLASRERMLLARRLAEIELQMFVTDAFFHADLHPGNIFFKPDGRIVILDVGMVGRIEPADQDRFLCYWIAISRNQRRRALQHLLKILNVPADADLAEFQRRYSGILDRFYGAALSERSMAQTYLEILLAASDCRLGVPSEMILQAKALVTAEALDLVLYPDFQFTEEARPIVARELARRARPDKLLDRIWSGLAEYILLGELPPAGPVSTKASLDERRFRRELLKSVAYEWADYADEKLRRWQADVARYTSSGYWNEHAEFHAATETVLALSRLAALEIDRAFRASELDARENSSPPGEHAAADDAATDRDGKARYRAFHEALRRPPANGNAWTEDLRQMLAYWESQARSWTSENFWDDKQLLRSALQSGLSLVRLLASQAAQAIEGNQKEKSRNDPPRAGEPAPTTTPPKPS